MMAVVLAMFAVLARTLHDAGRAQIDIGDASGDV